MKIVVGLGNPGEEYSRTRHNLGYRTVEEFCRREGLRWSRRVCRSRLAQGGVGSEEVMVAQPETYMNASGDAVACLLARSGATPGDLLVVCDDVAIDLGALRVRPSGSDGGHRGLRSIARRIGTEDFARLRIGIRTVDAGRKDLAEHVLSSFDPGERGAVDEVVRKAAECIQVVLEKGIHSAMERYNRRQTRDPQDPRTAE